MPLTRIALAELLLARAGTVASRQEILRTVWHTDHEDSNVIEAAIGSLRRKLGPETHRLRDRPRRGLPAASRMKLLDLRSSAGPTERGGRRYRRWRHTALAIARASGRMSLSCPLRSNL